MSPPLVDSPPDDGNTFKTPFLISHPFSGNFFLYAPVHPSLLLPSNNNLHPSLISYPFRELGIRFTTYNPLGKLVDTTPVVLILIFFQYSFIPACPGLLIE